MKPPLAEILLAVLLFAASCAPPPATTAMDRVFPSWNEWGSVEAFAAAYGPPELAPPESLALPIRRAQYEAPMQEVWEAAVLVVMQRGLILRVDGQKRRMIALMDLPFVAPPLFVQLHEENQVLEMVWLHSLYGMDAKSRLRRIRRTPPLTHTIFPLDEIAFDLLYQIEIQAGASGFRWLSGPAGAGASGP